MPVSASYQPAPKILRLGDAFYDPVQAADFPRAELRFRNDRAAARVGLDTLSDEEWIAHFGRFQALPANLTEPLALRYHGHQFRSWNPDLGDGRGFLFAQLLESESGRLLDLGTKGTGTTPYSRRGDGRLTLKGGVRELLATELLEARGVNTSKTFSLIETGERLARNDEPSPTRACALVRLSHSHIRFGTFQRLNYLKAHDALEQLLHYCADNYYEELRGLPTGELAVAFLDRVIAAHIETLGGWMASGFVHGVLNTDNMNITGESFDYGPWRWLPTMDPSFTAAYFDHGGLYAYERQPSAVLWNLARLAETLLPFAPLEQIKALLGDRFIERVTRAWSQHFLRLLGLRPHDSDQDDDTLMKTVQWLHQAQIPYDQFLYDWYGASASLDRVRDARLRDRYDAPAFEDARRALLDHAPVDPSRMQSPYFSSGQPISNHIDVVEALWGAIDRDDDWSPLMTHIQRIRESAL